MVPSGKWLYTIGFQIRSVVVKSHFVAKSLLLQCFFPRSTWRREQVAQRTQYPLIKEYTLHGTRVRVLNLI